MREIERERDIESEFYIRLKDAFKDSLNNEVIIKLNNNLWNGLLNELYYELRDELDEMDLLFGTNLEDGI